MPVLDDFRKPNGRPRKLTAIERAFVKAYLANGGDRLAAYAAAVPDSIANANTRNTTSKLILARPVVRHAIDQAQRVGVERVSEVARSYAIDQENIAMAMARLAYSSIADVCTLEHEQAFTMRRVSLAWMRRVIRCWFRSSASVISARWTTISCSRSRRSSSCATERLRWRCTTSGRRWLTWPSSWVWWRSVGRQWLIRPLASLWIGSGPSCCRCGAALHRVADMVSTMVFDMP